MLQYLAVTKFQMLFVWRPFDMTNPHPSFFSFKSIIENSKMQVGILNLCIYQPKKCSECSYKNT